MASGSPKTKALAAVAVMMFGGAALQAVKGHTVAAFVAIAVGSIAALQAAYFWRKYR